MLIALLVINKKDGVKTILAQHGCLLIWATKEEAIAKGDEMFGKDNSHVAYQAVVIGYELE
jgi:hypothetical protein